MKHEHFPSMIVLMIFLVTSISLVSMFGQSYFNGNIGGKAVEPYANCAEEQYCTDWDWFDSKEFVCVDSVYVESKICTDYQWDPDMKCVSWEYDTKEVCNEWQTEAYWSKECSEWSVKYVC